MLAYLFTAHYDDGSAYSQNPEDTSLEEPGRPSFWDLNHAIGCPPFDRIVGFELRPAQDAKLPIYGVSLIDGTFYKDGVPLPAQTAEREPATPRRLVYGMTVREHRITPAAFYDPISSVTQQDGTLHVTDSKGEVTVFPEVSIIAQETAEDGRKVFRVWPTPKDTERDFIFGWQANDAEGRNIQQTITI